MNINIINKAQASKIAGVSEKTIHNWAEKGLEKGGINKYWIINRKTFKVSEWEVREVMNKRKAFCPTCGELEIVDGEVKHPAHDKLIYDMLNSGFKSESVDL